MLNIYVDNARVAVENLKRSFASPPGVFIYAALSGMGGVVIILTFLSMILAESSLSLLLPVIISFNAANSGFYLVDRGGRSFPHLRICLLVISGLLVAAGCFFLTVLLPWESMADGIRYLISGLSALIFSFFGAWIGSKKTNMDRASICK